MFFKIIKNKNFNEHLSNDDLEILKSISEEQNRFTEIEKYMVNKNESDIFNDNSNLENVLVFGDSHALDLYVALKNTKEFRNYNFEYLVNNDLNCFRIKNDKDIMAKRCYEMMQQMYKNEYSEVLKMFYGIHVSQICSVDGKIVGANPEPYFMIDLPIFNRESNIIECFDNYTAKERLDGDNQWYNEKTSCYE